MGCFFYFRGINKNKWKYAPEGTRASSSSSKKEASRPDDSVITAPTSKSLSSTASPRSLPSLYEERGQNLRVFELKELRAATNDFNRLLKIGEGGFGGVYKGFIKPADGMGERITVAVKMLNQHGLQGHKQWLAEVQFLGVVDHPNLVKLIGYCAVDGERGPQRLLVYEFMPNKSLDYHLFSRSLPPVPWKVRLQIALSAAEGLLYLHEGLEVQVIYRDFKASNILLDEEFKPKLSDFGLAREGPSGEDTHVSTAVMGTHGYAAPDYIETGHLTAKSDVWSFGVVLYELITGRRSMERNRPKNEQKLLNWVKQFPPESKKFSTIMDPRLSNKYSMSGARTVAKLADSCLSKLARNRPKMSEVVEILKHAMQFKEEDVREEPFEGEATADLESEKTEYQRTDLLSARRRMLHLAKLAQSTNAVGRRKYGSTAASNPS
ncbi:probable serine/threonine-protein kinase PBL19 [Dendrobium catenatum]|uniref:Putative receptor-like protein kinase n=1 Tax=Dendrobium catenatum TaxID=906689 RepID=A0A2I0X435_9ASPA|nr:probable serine/threonine-protein kinase PBL19 [Dendrobium catenatum]PKU82684.1 putative receptor-like protein kinase [Dendrobium catenatum]